MKKYILIALAVLFVIFKTHAPSFNFNVKAESSAAAPEISKPEFVMQTGHAKTIYAVVFSPDNSWAATGSYDDTIKIWAVESGRELRSLSGHDGAVNALSASPDGHWIASGGNDKLVKVWDVEKGIESKTLRGHESAVETVAFSADGTRLASGGADKNVIIWDAASGRQLTKLPEHTDSVTALAFSRDGKFLASGSADNSIKIWDLEKNRLLQTLKGSSGRITSLAFSANGENLASGGEDKSVRWWKISNGRKLSDFGGNGGCVLAVALTPDEKIASVDSDRNIKFWDTLKVSKSAASAPAESGCGGEAQSAVFSQNGQLAAIGNGDGTVFLIDVKSGKKVKTLENHTSGNYGVAFSQNRRWLASANFDNTIKLWDLQTGQSIPPLIGHTGRVTAVSFHPDNQRVISTSLENTVKVWDISTGKNLNSLEGHTDTIGCLAVGAKGDLIVSGSKDQTARLWNLETQAKKILSGHTGEVTAVAVSPDEQIVATGSTDKTIKLWNAQTQTLISILSNHTNEITSIAFSPDGSKIVSGSADKTIRVWNAAGGQLVKTIQTTGKVNSVAFSPDGKQIAAGGEDNSVSVWDTNGGAQKWTTTPHVGAVFALSFTADGHWLASSSADGIIAISNAENGDALAKLLTLKDGSDWLVATPDGLFDGSPAAWEQIIWRFGKNTFNVKPVEVFFKEFYYPGLLAKILSDGKLPSTSSIVNKDRRQPTVNISLADGKKTDSLMTERELKIKIKVAEAPPDENYQTGSGARDVRLFRNGLLVKQWSGNVLSGGSGDLEMTVSLVRGQNQLTAYAYNNDNIKSVNANLNVKGADSLGRKGVFYIVAVAVSQYANPKYNLDFIDKEAREFAEQLRSNLSELKEYQQVEVVPLINSEATKSNILNAFKRLAGNKNELASNGLVEEESGLERNESETPLAVGDRIRFSIESLSRSGYLYIVDRELYSDGTYSAPKLVYPTLNTRGANKTISAGNSIFIPQSSNYFIVKPQQDEKKQVAEVLTVIVSPKILIAQSMLDKKAIDLPKNQFDAWLKQWEVETTLLEQVNGAGTKITLAEQTAALEAAKGLVEEQTPLTQDDPPPPQSVFLAKIKRGDPFLVNVFLKFRSN